MNTTDFVNKNNITIEYARVKSNPNMDEGEYKMNHYEVSLHYGRSEMTVYYSMGMAHKNKPKAGDVLDCLANDSSGIDSSRSFEDWCGDYGYDTDSRKAERTYNACVEQRKKLEKFLGDKYDELLNEVERL